MEIPNEILEQFKPLSKRPSDNGYAQNSVTMVNGKPVATEELGQFEVDIDKSLSTKMDIVNRYKDKTK